MKNNRATLGWSRRNTWRYCIALPNSIWQHGLKPKAFAVLCYLVYRQGHKNCVALTVEQIMSSLNMSKKVATENLGVLRSAGFINEDGALANMVTNLSAGFFSLPNEVYLLKLSPGALAVYAYLVCCADWRTKKCHPSYKTIAAHTRMCVSTAENRITELVDAGLIAAEHSDYFRYGLKRIGNNIYTLLSVRGVAEAYYQRQLQRLEQETACHKAQKKLESFSCHRPKLSA